MSTTTDNSASPINSQPDTLHIGLCMAGAVSAGAYTAGMMDYLLETLERWEKARAKAAETNDDSVPLHKISIDVMAGTSAGGMTAAITAAAMQCHFPHVNFDNYNDTSVTDRNKLFSSWVNLTDDADMLDRLLDNKDIKLDTEMTSHRAASMLNSSFIDTIATKVLLNPVCDDQKRPYISENLDIWLALSNINGIRHNLSFHSMPDSHGKPADEVLPDPQGDSAYISHNYRDFIHFRISENKTPSFIQQVNFREKNHSGATLLRDAAMATGAFPIGLTARMLKRPRNLILGNPLYKLLYGFYITDDLIRPDDTYVIVDGGMMNNEPFEVTRILLMLSQEHRDQKAKLEAIVSEKADRKRAELAFRFKEMSAKPLDQLTKEEMHDAIRQTEELRVKTWDHSSHDKFTRTVILVDPFPSHTDPDLPGKKEGSRTQITEVLNGLVNAATGQLLFKVDDIEEAMDADNYSRFLIVPKRKVPTPEGDVGAMGSSAIACGAISGFSGFFNRQYRVHDYLLGRRNCQRFLQTRFLVPAETTNPIFINGYRNDSSRKKFTRTINGKHFLPIIPDINPETLELNTKPENTIFWPNQQNIGDGFDPAAYLQSHKKALGKRLSLVMKDLIFRQTKLNWISKQYLVLPFRWPIRNTISSVIIDGMIEKIRKHHLCE